MQHTSKEKKKGTPSFSLDRKPLSPAFGMEKFDLHILGCGSALPTLRHCPTSQVLNIHDKLYMIDCGEGTQQQFRRTRLSFARLNHIFISHLHGDHCFGLMGLISTFSLLGRTATLHIYAPEGLKETIIPLLEFYCKGMEYSIEFHPFATNTSSMIFEDKTLTVQAVPMRHRTGCCGFVFREKQGLPHIRRDMIDFLGIPLCEINRIKRGGDWVKENGEVIPHERLVTAARPPRSYAYFSDTAFVPENAEQAKNVDLMFHEATFAESEAARAVETFHSTASQAARMAQLACAKRLVIGHFSSRYDNEDGLLKESRDIFPNTVLAREGLQLRIGE